MVGVSAGKLSHLLASARRPDERRDRYVCEDWQRPAQPDVVLVGHVALDDLEDGARDDQRAQARKLASTGSVSVSLLQEDRKRACDVLGALNGRGAGRVALDQPKVSQRLVLADHLEQRAQTAPDALRPLLGGEVGRRAGILDVLAALLLGFQKGLLLVRELGIEDVSRHAGGADDVSDGCACVSLRGHHLGGAVDQAQALAAHDNASRQPVAATGYWCRWPDRCAPLVLALDWRKRPGIGAPSAHVVADRI